MESNMIQYELSKYDFEALDKAINNVLGYNSKKALTTTDKVTLERLQEKLAGGFTAWIETEE